jgi:hypothetical protein
MDPADRDLNRPTDEARADRDALDGTGSTVTWDGTPVPPPSSGPHWDAAAAMGLDMGLLEASIRMTPAERADRLQDMLDFIATVRDANPQLG